MMSVMQALKDDPDSAKANRDVVEKVLPKVPSEARAAFMKSQWSPLGLTREGRFFKAYAPDPVRYGGMRQRCSCY